MSLLNSFFIASGTNLGDRASNLAKAKIELDKNFKFIAQSKVYESPAVDYLNQPDFFNQVLEYELPNVKPEFVMELLLKIEHDMGRNRLIPKGPRLIDLDLLFWSLDIINSDFLQIPHPRLFTRSFVVLPLSELPGF
ncbi:MAG: 2-amino-4-hydroxy-6-hydroxymethyldihydropteridine diphosphokinase, partial [Bacteriovorax sp.]|nr:2-amino-4-hydroxy-6-hydroxymethyldihydropteridine diphosphokinase [Bacteriovorax sp.]